MTTITELSHKDAAAILDAIRSDLESRKLGAACAVVDSHGELMAFLRADGCGLPSIKIAISKAFTAAGERMSSRQVGENAIAGNFPMTNYGDLSYVSWGGGLPIVEDGKVIGAVGVSGLNEAEEERVAELGIRSLKDGGKRS